MTTNIFYFSFPLTPFYSPLFLRWNSWKTAGPYVPTSLWKQQCSTQHWQHTEYPLFQQQCDITPGREKLRSNIGEQRFKGLCVDISFLKLKELVQFLLKKWGEIILQKRLFLGKPLCVWVCVCTHSAWVSTAFWIFCSVLCSTCDKATNFTVLQPVLGVCGPLMWNLCQFGKMLLCLYDFFFP